jgi:hypothetical protein
LREHALVEQAQRRVDVGLLQQRQRAALDLLVGRQRREPVELQQRAAVRIGAVDVAGQALAVLRDARRQLGAKHAANQILRRHFARRSTHCLGLADQ